MLVQQLAVFRFLYVQPVVVDQGLLMLHPFTPAHRADGIEDPLTQWRGEGFESHSVAGLSAADAGYLSHTEK
jgi:hypothetical protein